MKLFKVSSNSKPGALAGALAAEFRQQEKIEVQVIGAGALNQAVKGIAIARGYVAPSGIDLVCTPMFGDLVIDDKGRTTIKLVVEKKNFE